MVFFSLIFVLISGVAATVSHVKTSVKTQKSFVTCVGNGYKVYMLCFIALSLSFSLSLSLSVQWYYELRLLLSKLIYKETVCNLNPVNVWVFPSWTIYAVTFVISLMNIISLVGPFLLRNLNVGWWACDIISNIICRL